MDRTPFAIFLIHKRQQTKLSQRGLAKALSVTQTKVHGWEKGSRAPHSRHLLRLFSALELNVEDQQLALILLAQS
tara:strand:- start:718 stop:942 length:225 start_codon:yes stop_codon:yes gene_type:complete